MNHVDRNRYRPQLEDLRRRLRSDAATVAGQALGPSGGQDNGELSNAPFHLADDGTDEFLHDMSAALAENEVYLLQEINDALVRIDARRIRSLRGLRRSQSHASGSTPCPMRGIASRVPNEPGRVAVNLNTGRPQTPADTLAPEGAMQEGWRPRCEATCLTAAATTSWPTTSMRQANPAAAPRSAGWPDRTTGDGTPEVADLQDAAGSGEFDADEARDDDRRDAPRSGPSGGAVGGTPARKRAT